MAALYRFLQGAALTAQSKPSVSLTDQGWIEPGCEDASGKAVQHQGCIDAATPTLQPPCDEPVLFLTFLTLSH